ncbi:MAG: helix-turn-helix domain-containing protein [Planctomycetaceae bacterium]|nr:helix-turn-helix domain-containing protein [Planctomycetaceae bacterium]
MAVRAKTDEQRLLLRPREAAMLLSVSERQLWQHTSPRGPIPATRIGHSVRYSPEALQRFIESQQGGTAERRVSNDA